MEQMGIKYELELMSVAFARLPHFAARKQYDLRARVIKWNEHMLDKYRKCFEELVHLWLVQCLPRRRVPHHACQESVFPSIFVSASVFLSVVCAHLCLLQCSSLVYHTSRIT
jgi:hypothetical protein